jgi:hypothetical protein
MTTATAPFRVLRANASEKGSNRPSAALVALVIYLVASIMLEGSTRHLLANDTWSQSASTAIADFNKLVEPPQIIFIGSSLVRRPNWALDSRHSLVTRNEQYDTYHSAKWFEKQLDNLGLKDSRVFSLAVDGATASDTYLIFEKLLDKSRRPNLIIYGVATRDIACCLFNCERNTPVFRLLFEPSDCSRLGNLFTTCFAERLELELNQRFPLFQNRDSIREILSSELQKLTCLRSTASTQSRSDAVDMASQPISAIPAPRVNAEMNKRFGDSHSKDSRRLQNQRLCLQLLAQRAAERNVPMLFVNMPVGPKYSGVGTQVYNDFLTTLHNSCSNGKDIFLADLNSGQNGFGSDCFDDGVHLNAKGGEKFIEALLNWIGDHPQLIICSDSR